MNPTKSDEDSGEPFFHRHYHHYHHNRQILDDEDEAHRHFQSSVLPGPTFSIYRDTDEDDNSSPGPSDDDPDDVVARASHPSSSPALSNAPPNSQTLNSLIATDPSVSASIQSVRPGFVNPEPHISSQFYTFNKESHSLMIKCLVEGRLATPAEIRVATSPDVLRSWRAVWKDRNEDTAYATAWKRIQDKLQPHVDEHGNRFLCFKNSSSQQFVSHFNQWQDIVMSFHGDSDLKHLGLRETIERIKQVWTVGAKFYGIPESFIRVCVAACSVCSGLGAGDGGTGGFGGGRPKRRRFEYTESFDVPAKEVPNMLQQLHDYQYNMGLLLIEKNDLATNCEDLRHEVAEAREIFKCEQSAHLIAMSEAEKREENLKRTLDLEKNCVVDLERAVHEMSDELEQAKATEKTENKSSYRSTS